MPITLRACAFTPELVMVVRLCVSVLPVGALLFMFPACAPGGWRPLPRQAAHGLIGPQGDATPPPACGDPAVGGLIINEVLSRPIDIDVDGDGSVKADDEAIELVNVSSEAVELAGVGLSVGSSHRGAIAAGVCLGSGQAALLLGRKKAPSGFDPEGVVRLDHTLRLPDAGATLTLTSAVGAPLDVAVYSASDTPTGRSLSRERDGDRDAPLLPTPSIAGSNGAAQTLGTCLDGSAFPDCLPAPQGGIAEDPPTS